MSRALAVVIPLVLAATTGCGPRVVARGSYATLRADTRRPTVVPPVTQEEWSLSRRRLGALRAIQPKRPFVERVRVSIVDPRTGKRYDARGAVAVDPGRAVRMMLVGAGGATALDAWVTKDRFRFVIPAAQLERRGGRDPEAARGLPIGFLRWWFLAPLEGRLLTARSNRAESAWLLRDGPATVTLRGDGQQFRALRRDGQSLEGIEWFARGLVPTTGARGRYLEGTYGLSIDVVVEEVLADPPEPDAFVDPDEEETRP